MQQVSLKLFRTWKEGSQHFIRNGWLTFATVSVLALSLFIGTLSVLSATAVRSLLDAKKENLSIAVSFNTDIPEERIQEIRRAIESRKEIASVQYVSREQALEELLARSGNDEIVKKAVETIGENPLLPTLVVRAKNPDDYGIISESLQGSVFQNDINRINYERNRKIIERLSKASQAVDSIGAIISAFFVVVATLITFNAIRITIYSSRQEFEIMRLVGASNLYVRMPFVFEGILYGIVGAILALILLFAAIKFLDPHLGGAFGGGLSAIGFFLSHLPITIAGLISSGALLGILSGEFAIRRYLKF